jgi:hypothetical protein
MEPLKPKLLMVLSPDITDNIKKVNKPQPTQLPVFSHGLEDFFIELSLIIYQNLKNSVTALKLLPLNVFKTDK